MNEVKICMNEVHRVVPGSTSESEKWAYSFLAYSKPCLAAKRYEY
jgi:hypothetical protein